ncbi:MAG: archease [Candidatus Omnitrophica bacterium]|nr:archease [Candidatus Omnitrophota bacterium]
MFKLLDHPADVRLKVSARTLESLFESAARGLMSLLKPMGENPAGVREIRLEAVSREELLVRFLEELIYLVEVKGKFPVRLKVKIDEEEGICRLQAKVTLRQGKATREVKAATYHGLKILQEPGGYSAAIIFDV